MTIRLDLDYEITSNLLKNKDFASLANYLNEKFKLQRNSNGQPIPFEFSLEIINFLHEILVEICDENVNETHIDILTEVFRSLRNYVINVEVQRELIANEQFLLNVKKVLLLCIENVRVVLQIILQFLVNLTVNQTANQVYSVFGSEILFLLKEKICIYESSALFYNIILQEEVSLSYDFYSCILDLYESHPEIEFLHFLIEKFLTRNDFWLNYKNFEIKKRLIVLAIIRHKQIEGEELELPLNGIQTLTQSFVNSGNIIFQTASNTESSVEAYEVSELSQVISSLCSKEEYLRFLQNDKDLLINSGVLLINVHRLGKESDNYFTSIQSLSQIRQPNKQIYEHPAFGFKADLIRIIGNLCWKNKVMQDLTREAELIPVILDCCNMDARNPFIMQWVILAVRNLCENNIENQKIIAGLHQEGTVSSSVLEELGLTLDSNGDSSLKIVPLETLHANKEFK